MVQGKVRQLTSPSRAAALTKRELEGPVPSKSFASAYSQWQLFAGRVAVPSAAPGSKQGGAGNQRELCDCRATPVP